MNIMSVGFPLSYTASKRYAANWRQTITAMSYADVHDGVFVKFHIVYMGVVAKAGEGYAYNFGG